MLQIERIGADQLDALRSLWKADWLEKHEGDMAGSERAADEIDDALASFDFFASNSFWIFGARVDGTIAGYATVVRIPKLDGRKQFLFIDELFVLERYRRQGIGGLLLERVVELAGASGAAGVRLIVECDNAAARALYSANLFDERPVIFCQRTL